MVRKSEARVYYEQRHVLYIISTLNKNTPLQKQNMLIKQQRSLVFDLNVTNNNQHCLTCFSRVDYTSQTAEAV